MHRRPKHEWGAHLWAFIHTVTVVDFEDGKNRGFNEKAVEVLRGVERVIPCEKCRAKYTARTGRVGPVGVHVPLPVVGRPPQRREPKAGKDVYVVREGFDKSRRFCELFLKKLKFLRAFFEKAQAQSFCELFLKKLMLL